MFYPFTFFLIDCLLTRVVSANWDCTGFFSVVSLLFSISSSQIPLLVPPGAYLQHAHNSSSHTWGLHFCFPCLSLSLSCLIVRLLGAKTKVGFLFFLFVFLVWLCFSGVCGWLAG